MRRTVLAAEFLLLFVGLPLLFRSGILPIPLFPTLWIVAAGCLVALLRDPGFDRRRLWAAGDLARRLGAALLPFLLAAPLLAAWVWWFEPERLFAFPRRRPLLWCAVMLLYPVLSVYPQGLVYRVFLFRRYRDLLPGRWSLVVASALAFALAHIVFRNWVAPGFSLLGGLLFAWTYERTGSSLVAAVQHAAFGCWVFTTGMGWHFYYGAVVQTSP